jgi:hypothetical protein
LAILSFSTSAVAAIRSIDLLGDRYVIVAGPVADEGTFALYRWSGNPSDKARPMNVTIPTGIVPEGTLRHPGSGDLMMLSDDGSVNPEWLAAAPTRRSSTSARSVCTSRRRAGTGATSSSGKVVSTCGGLMVAHG